MANEFTALNLLYLDPDTDQYVDEIRIQRFVVEGWLNQNIFPEGQSMLVQITNPFSGVSRVCSFVTHSELNRNQVFVPAWILENLGLMEEYVEDQLITIEPYSESVPSGTMITLKPLDNAIYHTDMRACFEEALDRFHVLQEGMMLKVRVPSLGDYTVSAYVDKLEPGPIIRLGGEIRVEFLEPEGGIPEFVKSEPEPLVKPIAEPIQDFKAIQETVRASWLKKFKK